MKFRVHLSIEYVKIWRNVFFSDELQGLDKVRLNLAQSMLKFKSFPFPAVSTSTQIANYTPR